MFLHFMIAGLFIAFGIWTYTNLTLEKSYAIQVSLMFLMVIIWVGLYVGGRIGKSSSKKEMHDLNIFMNQVLNKKALTEKDQSKLLKKLTNSKKL